MNWLLIDLNSFFASVEQAMNPQYRGKPIAVVAMITDTTSVLASSVEAKKFGVKTGTSVRDAKQMCPGIIFIAGKHEHYGYYHDRIAEALENCHPISAVMSIDEFAFRLQGRDRQLENAIALGKQMKESILKISPQLTSSVGLAPNRFLAKVASDMQKPDGLTVIKKEELPERLHILKLQDFPGVGRRMLDRLHQHGITTVSQLLARDRQNMRAIWGGIVGERFYDWVRGENFEVDYASNKSISQSHVLPPDLRNPQGAYIIAQKLIQKASARLRKAQMWTRHIGVYVKYIDGNRHEKAVRTLDVQDPISMQEVLKSLWPQKMLSRPIKVSILFTNLILERERSLSFFEDKGRQKLGTAMDKLNGKFGKNTLYFASLHNIKSAAPTRIAFSNIPDFADEKREMFEEEDDDDLSSL